MLNRSFRLTAWNWPKNSMIGKIVHFTSVYLRLLTAKYFKPPVISSKTTSPVPSAPPKNSLCGNSNNSVLDVFCYNRPIKQKILLFIIFAAILAWFINHQIQASSGNLVKFNPKKSQIVSLEKRDIRQNLTLAGSVNTDHKAVVKFSAPGKLVWVGVRIGDRVKKGQAIASLDKTELVKYFQKSANDYLAGYNNFLDSQAEYQDEKDRYLITDTIKRTLERSQYTLNKTVLDYEIAELAVKYATITSPINGIVTAIDEPYAGINIIPATATFTIHDPQKIYFSAEVDQEDVTKLKTGQKGEILLDSFSNQKINSTIIYTSFNPIPGTSTTSYEIRLPLDNSNGLYRLCMTGDITIPLAQATNVFSLPTSAISTEDNQSSVLVKQSNKEAKRVNVELGIESDDYVEIKSCISENDQIVIQ